MEPSEGFAHQVAFITGGAHGIGAGIAIKFAELGADVAIFDHTLDDRAISLKENIEQLGQRCLLMGGDVKSSEQVENAVQQVYREWQRLDIVVNDAAICPFRDLLSITDDIWYDTLNVNLSGMFFVSRAAASVFMKQQHGVIINISTVSTQIATPHQVHYIASKSGVDGLTKALAVALAPYHVRVNGVAPGGVLTDINADVDFERAQWTKSGVPLRTGDGWRPIPGTGTPQDMANAVIFLASDAARFITGVTLPVDGGALII